jgi:hypothetical protein
VLQSEKTGPSDRCRTCAKTWWSQRVRYSRRRPTVAPSGDHSLPEQAPCGAAHLLVLDRRNIVQVSAWRVWWALHRIPSAITRASACCFQPSTPDNGYRRFKDADVASPALCFARQASRLPSGRNCRDSRHVRLRPNAVPSGQRDRPAAHRRNSRTSGRDAGPAGAPGTGAGLWAEMPNGEPDGHATCALIDATGDEVNTQPPLDLSVAHRSRLPSAKTKR